MTLTAQLVDSISDTATVRLDLNDGVVWSVLASGSATPAPALRRAVASTLLTDGDRYAAAAYGNRTIELSLNLLSPTLDQAADQVRTLTRELARTSGFLRWRPGTTRAVYFRLARGEFADVRWDPVARRVAVLIPAEPYAYGPETYPLGDAWSDAFGRTLANQWGSTDTLQPWVLDTVNAPASSYSVSGGLGRINLTSNAQTAQATLQGAPADLDVIVRGINMGGTPATNDRDLRIMARLTPAFDWVEARILAHAAGTVGLVVRHVGQGAELTTSGETLIPGVTPPTTFDLEVQFAGPVVRARAWITGSAQPTTWLVVCKRNIGQVAGDFAVQWFAGAGGNVYPAPAMTIDSITITPIAGVSSDPAASGPPLNLNPYATTNASDWLPFGGTSTVTRSTLQAHTGAASILLTPDGVSDPVQARNTKVTGLPGGRTYRASAWVRCPFAETVDLTVEKYAGATFLGNSTSTVAIVANTWTLLDFIFDAPSNMDGAQLVLQLHGPAPATHTLFIDEALLRDNSGPGSMYFDLTGIRGDVETPLVILGDNTDLNGITKTAIGVRRRGDVTACQIHEPAELMTAGTDTTSQPNDGLSIGPNTAFMRTTFATATMTTRLSSAFPNMTGADARGLYRAFLRYRRSSNAADTEINVQLTAGVANAAVNLAKVTAYEWIPVGLVAVPYGNDPMSSFGGNAMGADNATISLAAERVGPTAVNLDIDALVLIPADDGFAFVEWSSQGPTGFTTLDGALEAAYARTGAVFNPGTIKPVVPPPAFAGGLPMVTPGQTNRVYVALRALGGADLLTEAIALRPSYYPRYLFVRPVTE